MSGRGEAGIAQRCGTNGTTGRKDECGFALAGNSTSLISKLCRYNPQALVGPAISLRSC